MSNIKSYGNFFKQFDYTHSRKMRRKNIRYRNCKKNGQLDNHSRRTNHQTMADRRFKDINAFLRRESLHPQMTAPYFAHLMSVIFPVKEKDGLKLIFFSITLL